MPTPDLMTLTDPRSAAAEAYRTLRTNLMFSSVETPLKTLVLTAASHEDGKSIAIANLAVTFAQAGHTTILVDADLRQPRQSALWGISGDKGLTTMMLEDKALAEPPLIATSVDKLSLLAAGPLPPNPADLLSSRRMDEIIGLLKVRADYVLFDCAPVLQASDAVVLGRKVDGVLLVVRAGSSRRDHTAQAREALERVHVRILGAVLTNSRE
jgi:capsular exopolysaccharide synthesis family protein